MNPIGAHFSIKNGFLGAFKDALETGAEALQIFAKSPATAKLRSVTAEEKAAVENWPERKKIKNAVIHSSYLINLSAEVFTPEAYQIKTVLEDMRNAEALGADGAVVHMGKALDLKRDIALGNFVKNIKKIIELTDGSPAKLLIENTAGQGTETGFDIAELAQVYKDIGNKKRVKICYDTAHGFGAGYDIRDEENARKTAKTLVGSIGIENIACIHLNDSKKALNSRVDRHADLGAGEIGIGGLASFIRELNALGGENIPLILETPEDTASYAEQIKTLRSKI